MKGKSQQPNPADPGSGTIQSGQSDHSRAILWMVLATILFATVTVLVRLISSDMPAAQAGFIRYVIGTILLLPFILPMMHQMVNKNTSGKRGFDRRTMVLFSLRGILHGGAVILWFYAIAHIPIGEVTALGFTAPVYITIGAALFLGEKLAIRRISAVCCAFVGMMAIIRPGFQEIGPGHIAQLIAAPLFAASYLIARTLTVQARSVVIVGWLSIFVTAAMTPFALIVWQPPIVSDIAWLGVVAVLATFGHFALTQCFRAAPLAVSQPASFLQLVWAIAAGAILFGEMIDPFVVLGGGIIIASVSYITWRESVVKAKSSSQ
ncbi:MAG: DMT family transporter [Pseudomonadota bacterium]